MGGKRNPTWLVLGALAMVLALLWFLLGGTVPGHIWVGAAVLAVVAALLFVFRVVAGRRSA